MYNLNEEGTTSSCVLNEFQEYLEISPGCLISKDKIEEYKSNNKCQTCKYGYFKTKEETCVYCRSEQYGGPACYECGYENENGTETDNIICKACYSFFQYNSLFQYLTLNSYSEQKHFTTALSSKGKCFNCQYDLSENCMSCEFIKDNNDNEELKCNLCFPGFYLNTEGNDCIDFSEKIETAQPNCSLYEFNIGIFKLYKHDYEIYFENNAEVLSNLAEYNDAFFNINLPIKANCSRCDSGAILNVKNECEPFGYDKCIGNYILEDMEHRFDACRGLCDMFYYSINKIYIKLENNNMDMNPDNYNNINYDEINDNIISIEDMLQYRINDTKEETKNFLLESYLCLNNLDEDIKNRYGHCSSVLYIPSNKSYICLLCYSPYILNPENNNCYNNNSTSDIPSEMLNCKYENIGTNQNPIYSCIKCNKDDDILITSQSGIKYCDKLKEFYQCLEANITSTYYYRTYYNCTSCQHGYWPYYSKFYDREICQNINDENIDKQEISMGKYDREDDSIPSENGLCESG